MLLVLSIKEDHPDAVPTVRAASLSTTTLTLNTARLGTPSDRGCRSAAAARPTPSAVTDLTGYKGQTQKAAWPITPTTDERLVDARVRPRTAVH